MSNNPADIEKGRQTPTSVDEKGEGIDNNVQVTTLDGYDEHGNVNLGKSGIVAKEAVNVALQQRHLQMIALAGTIGTGLFLGSGRALATAGPVGLLLAYTCVASVVIGMILSLAEMAALVPISGSYVRHASLWTDDALSFAAGWNAVFNNIISIPAELVAAAVLFQMWTDVSPALFITILAALLIATNILTVKLYGEMEFTFSLLKIALVIGLIIFSICIDLGAGPNGDRIGFRYWKDPGPFKPYIVSGGTGKFVGFWAAMGNAAYSFAASETVAMAAAETKNPRRNIPLAAKRIFARVLIFYIIAIFCVGLIVRSDDEELLNDTGTASSSPFVVAANRAGVKALGHIVNAVVVTSAWSAANSQLMNSSRALYGLALDGNAPKIFKRVHRWGVPYVGVIFVMCFYPLAYMSLADSATEAFGWMQSMVSSITLMTWCAILFIYCRFYAGMKYQGVSREDLPYRAPFQPYIAYWSFGLCSLLLLTGGFTTFIHGQWDFQTFFSAYFSIPLFFIFLFGYKFARKTKLVRVQDMRIKPFVEFAKSNPEPPASRKSGVIGFVKFILWG